ncbi:hypothetical protein [Streptomyces sp. NBRC 110465]|uniref:hypothetical protein n=1 Tax=Streptomyces sp. NBRC 110465 TaxID=1897621 RepID=UPI0015B84FBF|nr:hypothetical protein [Streptomyces sp. NBRC 110465]
MDPGWRPGGQFGADAGGLVVLSLLAGGAGLFLAVLLGAGGGFLVGGCLVRAIRTARACSWWAASSSWS